MEQLAQRAAENTDTVEAMKAMVESEAEKREASGQTGSEAADSIAGEALSSVALQRFVAARKAESENACTLPSAHGRSAAYEKLSGACTGSVCFILCCAIAVAERRPLVRSEGERVCDAVEELVCTDPRMEQWESDPASLHEFLRSFLLIAPAHIARSLYTALRQRDFFPQAVPQNIVTQRLRAVQLLHHQQGTTQSQLHSGSTEQKRKRYTQNNGASVPSAADIMRAKQSAQRGSGSQRHDCEPRSGCTVTVDSSIHKPESKMRHAQLHLPLRKRSSRRRSASQRRREENNDSAHPTKSLAVVQSTPARHWHDSPSCIAHASEQVEATPLSVTKTQHQRSPGGNEHSAFGARGSLDMDALPPTPLLAICHTAGENV